jgi:5-formyltetrahydrofolate cyclo-ligase
VANSSIRTQKESLRLQAKQNLQKLSKETRENACQQIIHSLAELIHSKDFPQPIHLATFSALALEPDLSQLHGLLPQPRLYYPLCHNDKSMEFYAVSDPNSLKKGKFGILSPQLDLHQKVQASQLQALMCPAWAFTEKGVRLGKGGGYYDRFIAKHPTVLRIGVCFDCQILPCIPIEKHDFSMEYVVSESRIISI